MIFCTQKNAQSIRTKGYSPFSKKRGLFTAEAVLLLRRKKSTPFQWRTLGKLPCRG
jgi:hypothetical protein